MNALGGAEQIHDRRRSTDRQKSNLAQRILDFGVMTALLPARE